MWKKQEFKPTKDVCNFRLDRGRPYFYKRLLNQDESIYEVNARV